MIYNYYIIISLYAASVVYLWNPPNMSLSLRRPSWSSDAPSLLKDSKSLPWFKLYNDFDKLEFKSMWGCHH